MKRMNFWGSPARLRMRTAMSRRPSFSTSMSRSRWKPGTDRRVFTVADLPVPLSP